MSAESGPTEDGGNLPVNRCRSVHSDFFVDQWVLMPIGAAAPRRFPRLALAIARDFGRLRSAEALHAVSRLVRAIDDAENGAAVPEDEGAAGGSSSAANMIRTAGARARGMASPCLARWPGQLG
jgi:hypothetical protein